MTNDHNIQQDHLMALVRNHLLPVVVQRLDAHLNFLKKVKDYQQTAIKDINDVLTEKRLSGQDGRGRLLEILIRYKTGLNGIVEAHKEIPQVSGFDDMFPEYLGKINEYLATIPDLIVWLQEEDHFQAEKQDGFQLKMVKRCKRICLNIYHIPQKLLNLARRVLSKKQKPLLFWKRSINLRNLAVLYFRELMSLGMKEKLHDIHLLVNMSTQAAWRRDEALNAFSSLFLKEEDIHDIGDFSATELDRAIRLVRQKKQLLQQELENDFSKLFHDFETALHKAGTAELPNFLYGRIAINRKHRILNHVLSKEEKGWALTRTGMFDDWGIDNELYMLIFNTFDQHFDALKQLKQTLHKVLYPAFDHAKDYLLRCSSRMDHQAEIQEQVRMVEQEGKAIREQFTVGMLPELSKSVEGLAIPMILDRISETVRQNVSRVSPRRAISKTPDYTRPFRKKDIRYVSPYDLISFECLPKLMDHIDAVREELDSKLISMGNIILETGQIAEFGMETALDSVVIAQGHGNPAKIAAEGIERSVRRMEQAVRHCDSLTGLIEKDVFDGLRVFAKKLEEFTDNSSIIEITIRILRGKAVKSIKAIRQELFNRIRQMLPELILRTKQSYRYATSRLGRISMKYGLILEKESLTADVAGILTEARQVLLKLPFVYQRLFKISPLTEKRFFLGRTDEMETLQSAYGFWQKGQQASTLIVGEKGSGATSLINIFLGGLEEDVPVIRLKTDMTLHTETGLVQFLNRQLNREFLTADEWIGHLVRPGKTIIVLEDCQRLFLKKVNGFEAIRKLNEIIQKTGTHILWLFTFTEFAFGYLDRTIMLSEHFRFTIKLGVLPEHGLSGIIDQRHRVSGFNIEYVPTASDLTQKRYRTAGQDAKQAFLRNAYFSDLNRMARSNIRIALTYWVHSIREVRENTLYIHSLKELHFAFLNNLSDIKLFTLGALILHEMLREEDFGAVLHMDPTRAGRIARLLSGDGILIREDVYYLINPLLYRQITDILKNKNIIH